MESPEATPTQSRTMRERFDTVIRTAQEAALSTLGFFPRLAVLPAEAAIEAALGGMAKVHLTLQEPSRERRSVVKVDVTLGDSQDSNPMHVVGNLLLAGAKPIASLLKRNDWVAQLEQAGRWLQQGSIESMEQAQKLIHEMTDGRVEVTVRRRAVEDLLSYEPLVRREDDAHQGTLNKVVRGVKSYPLFSLGTLGVISGYFWPKRYDGQAGLLKRVLQVTGIAGLGIGLLSLFSEKERRFTPDEELLNEKDRVAIAVKGSHKNMEHDLASVQRQAEALVQYGAVDKPQGDRLLAALAEAQMAVQPKANVPADAIVSAVAATAVPEKAAARADLAG